MALFQDGFGKYLESGEFADVELVTERRTYTSHRLILMYSSEFFYRLFTSEFKEKSSNQVGLRFSDPDDIFPAVLRFMYTGSVEITDSNAIPLLALADHYLIDSLRSQTTDFILRSISRNNAMTILEAAQKFNLNQIIEKCISMIAKNLCHFPNDADWSFLPIEIFSRMLHDHFLTVSSEYSLYQQIQRYLKSKEQATQPLSSSQVQQLMEAVRFEFMTYDQLKEVKTDLSVPKDLLIDALLERVREDDQPSSRRSLLTRKRPKFGMQFEYKAGFENRGVIYWIATDGGKVPWRNPHSAGLIRVAASSNEKGESKELVSWNPTELWTQDVPASWFMIDLMENRALTPTHYTLRHGGNYKADSLRTWDLQGSNDGQEWDVLKRHTNDTSLNGKFATATWPVFASKPYQFFRIIQTGHNSSNHNFLVLSGVDFYGDFFEY